MLTEDGHTRMHTHTHYVAFSLVFLFSPCFLSVRLGIIRIALPAWLLQLSRVEQMSTALKDLVLLHSRTNEDVKKGLFTLTRKQRKETKRIRPWETCRRGLIRSCANSTPTLCTNSQ